MTETDIKQLNDSKTVAKPEDVEVDEAAASGPLLKRINALKNVQLQMVEIESKFYEELHQLECKYAHMYEPLFEKRRQIVVGEHEPTEEEAKWALDALNDEGAAANGEAKENGSGKSKIDESQLPESAKKLLSDLKAQFEPKKANGGNKDEKGVPMFWVETLQSFRITAEIIQEHDEPILAYLQDVRVILADQKPYGYTIEFHFADNPYFSNKVLTKKYELKTEVDPKDPFSYEGPDLAKAIGCTIDWKAGKNVTVKLTKKKLKSKNKKIPPKVITKEEKQDSFFNFFETPKGQDKKPKSPVSSGAEDNGKQLVKRAGGKSEDDEEDDEDEDAQEELYMIADFEIGQYLREKVVPKAILYYTGELDGLEEDYDDYEDEDDEEGDDDEDEEDEEDDDDDDDDEDDKKGPKGKKPAHGKPSGPKGGKTGGKPGEPTPSECKQN